MQLRRALRSSFYLGSFVALISSTFAAQDTHPPHIALVLSGGDVRGLAHVGVLKSLEEQHVPIDLVVGSEWGALVGGLYATGLDAHEIQSVLVSSDWIDALEDRTPRRTLSFRAKQDERDFLIDLPFGVGAPGLLLPPGILVGTRLRLELARLTMSTLGVERFDDLPTPFRAVATDLDLGDPVTLSEGSLARAIEASMCTPVIRPPVVWEGRRLISGSIADQLPIDVALGLGAEVVIMVDVTDNGSRATQLDLISIGERALQIVGRKNAVSARSALRATDVLCTPALDDVAIADFAHAPAIVERGYEAARALKDRLASLGLDPAAFAERESRRRDLVRRPPVIDAVRVASGCPLGVDAVSARLDTHVGARLDPKVASTDLARLYGLKLFQRVDFHLVSTGEDQADLLVDAEPTPYAPLQWRLGLVGEVSAGTNVNFVMGASVRYAPIDEWDSEWRARAEVGNRLLFSLERRQALDAAGDWFLVPHASFEKRPVRVTQDGDTVAQFSVQETDLGLDVVREIGDVWEASAGVLYRVGESHVDIGDGSASTSGNFQGGGAVAGLTCDSLDDTGFPRSGAVIRAEWFDPFENFGRGQAETARLRFDKPVEVGRGAITFGGELSTFIGKEGSVQSFFPLGGFLRLSGLRSDELSAPTAVLARAVYMLPFSTRALERRVFTWYGGASIEAGNVFPYIDRVTWNDLKPSGSLFLAVDTIIGPMFLGFGLTEGGNQSVFIALGRQF